MRRVMSPLLGWVGLVIAGLTAGLGAILGFWQKQPAQLVIVYTAATFALGSKAGAACCLISRLRISGFAQQALS